MRIFAIWKLIFHYHRTNSYYCRHHSLLCDRHDTISHFKKPWIVPSSFRFIVWNISPDRCSPSSKKLWAIFNEEVGYHFSESWPETSDSLVFHMCWLNKKGGVYCLALETYTGKLQFVRQWLAEPLCSQVQNLPLPWGSESSSPLSRSQYYFSRAKRTSNILFIITRTLVISHDFAKWNFVR